MAVVILISGWAMSADILHPLAEALEAKSHSVESMSLADAEGESWDQLLSALGSQVGSRQVVLVGWSLGGNLGARFAAKHPDKVIGLITMGSTPSFVRADDWPEGKHSDAYQEFADGVAADIQAAMKGFAPVCARGSDDLKAAIRSLRASAKWALSQGTDWRVLLDRLSEDARSEWQKVSCPGFHFLAENDPLAKPGIAPSLQVLMPDHVVRVLSGSHAVFLDHTDEVVQAVDALITKKVQGQTV